jgi:hypothetical protein
MASLIYNSFFEDWARGAIDLDTDAFWVMLTTSGYSENKDTHLKRSDVTNEVAAGGGYSTGGVFPARAGMNARQAAFGACKMSRQTKTCRCSADRPTAPPESPAA